MIGDLGYSRIADRNRIAGDKSWKDDLDGIANTISDMLNSRFLSIRSDNNHNNEDDNNNINNEGDDNDDDYDEKCKKRVISVMRSVMKEIKKSGEECILRRDPNRRIFIIRRHNSVFQTTKKNNHRLKYSEFTIAGKLLSLYPVYSKFTEIQQRFHLLFDIKIRHQNHHHQKNDIVVIDNKKEEQFSALLNECIELLTSQKSSIRKSRVLAFSL